MNRHIVVAFRMPPGGVLPVGEVTYLSRARSLCARGEVLGGRLVAWSAVTLAVAWDADSIEEAMLFATSARESVEPGRAWAGGLAEGDLEPLAPDGQRMHLAWGSALTSSVSLARVARPGEVLVDGDVRALRAGQLGVRGARSATDSGQRVRGWRLDLDNPWKSADAPHSPRAQLERSPEGLSSEDILEIVERASAPPPEPGGDVSLQGQGIGPLLADRVRALVGQDPSGSAAETLADLRRSRARAEGGPAAARCQAALALSVTLCIAGRTEEALLEGLDALARSREAQDPRAVGACLALLAKLYEAAGFRDAAEALKTG